MPRIRTAPAGIVKADYRTVKVEPKTADKELLSPEYRRWAEGVKRRAGYRCEWVENSARCDVKAPARLFADHPHERRDGGSLVGQRGLCLCGSHHTKVTLQRRALRLAERFDPIV